jgi:hypothetical protein
VLISLPDVGRDTALARLVDSQRKHESVLEVLISCHHRRVAQPVVHSLRGHFAHG